MDIEEELDFDGLVDGEIGDFEATDADMLDLEADLGLDDVDQGTLTAGTSPAVVEKKQETQKASEPAKDTSLETHSAPSAEEAVHISDTTSTVERDEAMPPPSSSEQVEVSATQGATNDSTSSTIRKFGQTEPRLSSTPLPDTRKRTISPQNNKWQRPNYNLTDGFRNNRPMPQNAMYGPRYGYYGPMFPANPGFFDPMMQAPPGGIHINPKFAAKLQNQQFIRPLHASPESESATVVLTGSDDPSPTRKRKGDQNEAAIRTKRLNASAKEFVPMQPSGAARKVDSAPASSGFTIKGTATTGIPPPSTGPTKGAKNARQQAKAIKQQNTSASLPKHNHPPPNPKLAIQQHILHNVKSGDKLNPINARMSNKQQSPAQQTNARAASASSNGKPKSPPTVHSTAPRNQIPSLTPKYENLADASQAAGKSNQLILMDVDPNVEHGELQKLANGISGGIKELILDRDNHKAKLVFGEVDGAVVFRRKYNRTQIGNQHVSIAFCK